MNAQRLTVIALGSNLGNSREIFHNAIDRLQSLSTTPLQASSFWETDPIDCPPGSPKFLNAVALLTPMAEETPESLLGKLQALEREFGRRPKIIVNEARPLDLDIVAFGNDVRSSAALTLPHPRAHLRKFVLGPLAELTPDYKLPGQTRSVSELLEALG